MDEPKAYIEVGNCLWYSTAFGSSRPCVITRVDKVKQEFGLRFLDTGEVKDPVPFVRPNPSSWGSWRDADPEDIAKHLHERKLEIARAIKHSERSLASSKKDQQKLITATQSVPDKVAEHMRTLCRSK